MNLARLLVERAERRGDLRLGVAGDSIELAPAVAAARRAAGALLVSGFAPDSRIAIVDATSTDYLVFWMACQLAGLRVALVNPTLPADLLAPMLEPLEPIAIAARGAPLQLPYPELSFREVRHGRLRIRGSEVEGRDSPCAGLQADELDICGYMHTSGTTGLPKFCAQSHRYFLRLGRFLTEQLALSRDDRVFAPLPMFHINPFGYGFLGSLTGLADLVTVERFSASGFWPLVRDEGITVLILHAPPVAILERRATSADARGHRVRAMFYADLDFMERFGVPLAVSGYGSTEAGGLCHAWQWRRGERIELREGVGRFGGRARADVEWRIADDGEIELRGREPGVLFSGYAEPGGARSALDPEGWFATGDLGRSDAGRLVFVERRAESIRARGEFVPIDYVEAVLGGVPGIDDLALWKRPAELAGDEPLLYVVAAAEVPVDELRSATAQLAPFMRPVEILRVAAIPRDGAAGKVQRRRLPDIEVKESWRV